MTDNNHQNHDDDRVEVIQPFDDESDQQNYAYAVESDRYIREEVIQTLDDMSAKRVSQESKVVPSDTTLQKARFHRTRNIVYFIVHVFTIILVIRFVLLAFGADPTTPFAIFWYALSSPIIGPFLGLFGAPTEPQYGVNIFEMSVFVAIAIYYLLAWIITRIAAFVQRPKTPLERAH